MDMTNKEIRQSFENNTELFDDSTAGIQECVQYTSENTGLSVAKIERALGWK